MHHRRSYVTHHQRVRSWPVNPNLPDDRYRHHYHGGEDVKKDVQ